MKRYHGFDMKAIALACVLVAATASFAGQKPHVKTTAIQARSAALAKYPGKVVGKIALENEDGKWQYAVNIRSGRKLREVMVDANTGKIANVEVTTAKEEAKEKAAEEKTKHKKGG
jgi:hypothetical protein